MFFLLSIQHDKAVFLEKNMLYPLLWTSEHARDEE